jgi:hypothetical protein
MHQKFWHSVAPYAPKSLRPKAILHSFGSQESQMPKLYKAMFLHYVTMVFRSILQKDGLKHQNFWQNGGTKQALKCYIAEFIK